MLKWIFFLMLGTLNTFFFIIVFKLLQAEMNFAKKLFLVFPFKGQFELTKDNHEWTKWFEVK